MRKIIFLIFALFNLFTLSAQTVGREGWKGVYGSYDFTTPRISAAAPEGYAPIYISHYGRHGARYLYNNEEYDLLYNVFAEADKLGALTDIGKSVWACISELYPHFKNRGADLTQYGQWQHRMLAERMCKEFPEIFEGEASVFALSSVKPRCIMSMASFCGSLAQHSNAKITIDVNGSAMPYLIPYQARFNPRFKGEDNSWRKILQDHFDQNFDTDTFYKRIFTNDAPRKVIADDAKFIQTLYYYDTHLGGTDFADRSIGEAFTDKEYAQLYELDNMKFFLRRGWGLGKECNKAIFYTESLVRDILAKADEDLASGEKRARLRFGHDGTLAVLLSFLEVDSWGKRAKSIEKIEEVWRTSRITMASNIRFVFYSNGKDILVKVQFNENDAHLPIKAVKGVFYRWEDFKNYLVARIEKAESVIE